MSIYVFDLYMHGEKISKTRRYVVIDSGKRTLPIIGGGGRAGGFAGSLSVIILCMQTQAFITSHICS
jgi:hypothetical protein